MRSQGLGAGVILEHVNHAVQAQEGLQFPAWVDDETHT